MVQALYEVLHGSYGDGTPVAAAGSEAMALSVLDHLRRLLNARAGSLQHLPEYGLPDLPSLYAELPYSAERLGEAIRRTVERFEPRLEQLHLTVLARPGCAGVLSVELSGRLPAGDPVRFESVFEPGGGARVFPVRAGAG